MRTHAYCPHCDAKVATEPYPLTAGPGGDMVDCCARCDSAGLYTTKESYLEAERRRFVDILECDHEWKEREHHRHDPPDRCVFCSLSRDSAAEDMVTDQIDTEALRDDHSEYEKCECCGQWKTDGADNLTSDSFKHGPQKLVCDDCFKRHE